MELVLNEFEGYSNPQNDRVGCVRSVCNTFSYKFSDGIYFLTGEIDSGAWSFAYSLLNNSKSQVINFKSIILNGKSITLKEIEKLSFNVGQYKIYKKKTLGIVLRQTLKKSKINYTLDEILDKFNIEKSRYINQMMKTLNLQIWICSAAIGYTLGKKIFIFPWISKKEFLSHIFLKIFRILSKEDVIVLVPCSEKIQIPAEEKFTVVRMNSLFEVDFENIER